ncbi:MAG: STAS domain-containing protein [Candidatus Gracilibacteria bacterium]|nr:STAS domain-containing protein [bacterium]MDZ4217123.1 STAS domain-containing protein [Candidatus Gracilibacteria bacterium]
MSTISLTFSELQVDPGKGKTMLAIFNGQLDETNIEGEAQKFYQMLEIEKPKNCVFDFTGLVYLNSKSIGYIADWQGKVAGGGGKLIIFGVQKNIFDILDVVGLTKIIDLVEHVDEAKEAL